MPTLFLTSVYSRPPKFEGLENSVCGGDGGAGYFMDAGSGSPSGGRGINERNETWRTP